MAIAGILYINVGGELVETFNDATLNFGGPKREKMMGHSVYGDRVTEIMPSEIQFEAAWTPQFPARLITNLSEGECTFRTDAGSEYSVTRASNMDPLEAKDGKVKVRIQGDPINP